MQKLRYFHGKAVCHGPVFWTAQAHTFRAIDEKNLALAVAHRPNFSRV